MNEEGNPGVIATDPERPATDHSSEVLGLLNEEGQDTNVEELEEKSSTGDSLDNEHGGLYVAPSTEGEAPVSAEVSDSTPTENLIKPIGTNLESAPSMDGQFVSSGVSPELGDPARESKEPLPEMSREEIAQSVADNVEGISGAPVPEVTPAEALARARRTADERGDNLDEASSDTELEWPAAKRTPNITGEHDEVYKDMQEGAVEAEKTLGRVVGSAGESAKESYLEKSLKIIEDMEQQLEDIRAQRAELENQKVEIGSQEEIDKKEAEAKIQRGKAMTEEGSADLITAENSATEKRGELQPKLDQLEKAEQAVLAAIETIRSIYAKGEQ